MKESSIPADFGNKIHAGIKEIIPDLSSLITKNFPLLEVSNEFEDSYSFLVGYVVGTLEGRWNEKLAQEIHDGNISSISQKESFEIHKIIARYRSNIEEKVRELIEESN